ncbi:Type IV secretion system protein virB8 [Paraburkholderia aspalathi]|uniref:type IV secretion system protein n=1 Tax=Paraburkholderia aspalathi TaxID=1324617 RepID=UPI00190BEDE4|nr:type IV secretion system protein [Paraburkholderia aspalathi]MBK3843856.1 type IV secretion system protein [Paraburkholderia aspalathi]CAE6863203.1 Type IV secretion system protein virB8 [Paraburkholderia aspalathi]CAE6863304.1 Type IV secretion system protein virB8 [Paraburkholderia aspalathi]
MASTIRQWFASATPARKRKGSPAESIAGADAPVGDVESGERDVVSWYLKQAQAFEKSKVEAAEEKARIADRRSVLSGVVALAAVSGMGALGLLKRPNPPAVLRVDSSTGKVDVLPTTANGHVTFSEKTDRTDLHRYVELRESYDWETISDTHAAVMFMSDDHEKEAYDGLVRGPTGPLKLLKDQARVIAHVGSITFVGTTAQVFCSRQLVWLNAAVKRPDPTYWIATVAFERVNVPEKQDQQDLNADGFRCTSYEVTRDWTRAPADAGATSGSASGSAAAGGGT